MSKYLCPTCQGPAERNGSRGYYKCANCGGLRLVDGKLMTLQQRKMEVQRFGPVEQFGQPMTWWEYEKLQD